MEANGHTGENRVGAAVSIRDLEVAVVLAREMSTASSRAVEASLRADQIQEVFGATALDGPERARIQTALEMAGLRPTPSLLEVAADGAVRFAVSADASAAAAAASPKAPKTPQTQPQSPPATATTTETAAVKPAAAPRRSEFPTVAEFAKTAIARVRHTKPGSSRGAGPNGATASKPKPARATAPPAGPGGTPRLDQLISVLIPALALPVLITSFLGWLFGLPFIALGLILSGRYLGKAREAGATTGVGPVVRGWESAQQVLKGVGALTAAAFVVTMVLALAIGDSDDSSSADVDYPAAPITTPLGDDSAARSEAREARSSATRAKIRADREARRSRRAAARRREAARERRAIRRRDRLIRQGLLLPNGLLTNEGVARGIKRPDAPPAAATAPPAPAPVAPAPVAPAPAPATP